MHDAHREVTIVHSSDLHLGTDDSFSDKDRLEVLPKVLSAATEATADIVLLRATPLIIIASRWTFSSAPRHVPRLCPPGSHSSGQP